MGLAYLLIRLHVGPLNADYTVLLLLLLGGMMISYDQFGLYRSNSSHTRKTITLFKAWTLVFGGLLLIAFATKQTDVYSRWVVGQLYVIGYLVQVALHFLIRELQIRLLRRAVVPEKVLIVGTGRLARYLHSKISNNPWLGQQVMGHVELPKNDSRHLDDPVTGLREPSDFAGLHQHISPFENMLSIIDELGIDTVYFAIPLDASELIEDMYFSLLDRHVAVHWVPDIYSMLLVNHSVREIAGLPVLTLSETPLTGTRLLFKAIEDFVLSALMLLAVSPLLLIIAVAVKLDSPGPVFFKQARNGWSGKTFHIWKFRSMHVHTPEAGELRQATRGDPRVTRVGAFLRKTSLDELPQLINVLRGEMSLVGPRPHAVQHDMEYSRRINSYFARHNIKPGITGLAQVRGFRGETRDIEQMQQRVESDIEYINNWSLWLDFTILLRTLGALTGRNAY